MRHSQLKVLASVAVVVVFVTLFVGGAVGLIGTPDAIEPEQQAQGGPIERDESESAPTESAPTETVAPSPTEEPTPVVTDVPPQKVKGAKKLQRSVAWLRRGLADETTFRVASFNVLGDSHTRPGGNKKGWASSHTRMGWTYSLIDQSDVSVIGFQEFEPIQYQQFLNLGGGNWEVFPGPTLDRGSIRNSLAWRTDVWELVEANSIGIPYFGGQIIRRPVVLLKNIESEREVWFFNTHNPASTPRWGNNARWRAAAIALEIQLANELGADGTPVVFTGDYNDRAEAFCPITGQTAMVAANGGDGDGGCVLPPSPDVDWIFGSGMEFLSFASLKQGVVGRVSDHPYVYAEAYIPEEPIGGQLPPELAEATEAAGTG